MNSGFSALVRAARGPVVLITIGIIFAIDHFGSLPFERTWPVLVIVIGAWKLLEFVVGRPAGPVPPAEGRV